MRCKADYSVLPIPKPCRVRDERAMDEARNRTCCECCGVTCKVDPHHIKSKGSGGADVRDNLVSVCRECHTKIHMGLISRDALRGIVSRRG